MLWDVLLGVWGLNLGQTCRKNEAECAESANKRKTQYNTHNFIDILRPQEYRPAAAFVLLRLHSAKPVETHLHMFDVIADCNDIRRGHDTQF